MNPVSGQWAQDATFHDYPGPVDYLLRDDFLSQTTRKAYGWRIFRISSPERQASNKPPRRAIDCTWWDTPTITPRRWSK